ncbi:polysaccharide deacetylase family protein [Desulfovibrio mangrovi]|uniref:polysaccharide deacetylase family protein n=1 Tax=Desulfovibrio mangrovi TaxID=2976983 RepID=UPI0022460924|nr:polysaccharide deacetylase family protein [Desulfovibrio mangrovi]UZP66641.1 polysaccharide deacetylase family protein [Desulfovibrio mangrovi]
MIATRPYVSALWTQQPGDLPHRLEQAIASGIQACDGTPAMFFRADDIGVPSALFFAMTDAFMRHGVPLGLATVPVWLTASRWTAMQEQLGGRQDLWCWHQHGWRHCNHEPEGRKYEFGPSRPHAAKKQDIIRGRQRLASIMGEELVPLFTPPWNRVDADTLHILKEQGYCGISRTTGARPPAPAGFTDVGVNVDLHTRREETPAEGWKAFLDELTRALASGSCGIMLHHQRMNANAVAFLDTLLSQLAQNNSLSLVHMHEDMA